MVRIEIIGSEAVEEEVIQTIEKCFPDVLYTLLPVAHGKGKSDYKKGDTTWPETNFVMVSYVDDDKEKGIEKVMYYIKHKFPDEGLKLFMIHDR